MGGIPEFTVAGVQVLNTYAALAVDAPAGSTTLEVADATLLDSPIAAIGALVPGDLLMVIQMQGATIDTSNTAQYGTVTALANAGNYELLTLVARNGNVLTVRTGSNPVSCSTGLQRSYTASGHVQVVRVPQFGTLAVPPGATVAAAPWDGSVGGVAVVQVKNALTLDGTIDVSGKGFRGGAFKSSSAAPGSSVNTYRSVDALDGAEKGEGIAGGPATYDALGGRFGRGAPANGGGGGDTHNAGGGGGANGNAGNGWTGQGVMLTTVSGAAAWQLDPNFAEGNSAGGGRGGYSFSATNQNALVTAPGSAVWGSDLRRQVGGMGGHPTTNDPSAQLFLGGGGGAGDGNNAAGGNGGPGGGLLVVMAESVRGAGQLLANGYAGASTIVPHNDAASGGGGGGTIVVSAGQLPATLSIRAEGGRGGDQRITNSEAEGPGGGGGGGFVAISGGTPAISVLGALGGTTTSSALTEFPSNGATAGAAGESVALAAMHPLCQPVDIAVTLTDGNGPNGVDPGSNVTHTATITNHGPYPVESLNLTHTISPALGDVGFTCVASATASCGAVSGMGTPVATGAIPAGQSVTFTVTGKVPTNAVGSLTYTIAVSVPAPLHDFDATNDTATRTSPVKVPIPDAGIPDAAPADAGSVDPATDEDAGLGVLDAGDAVDEEAGCACRSGRRTSGGDGLYATVLFGLALLWRRRRAA